MFAPLMVIAPEPLLLHMSDADPLPIQLIALSVEAYLLLPPDLRSRVRATEVMVFS